ncbi:MAG TPA: iron-containing alcohol dehydrogenase [Gaiellaceae bacterium]|nr:iron-containing alcohol dehydrogenase [Gaiellaceae bacterium]
MIVRWGLDELAGLLHELGIGRPFLIASDRWSSLDLSAAGRWGEVPTDRIDDIGAAAEGADALLVVGGGSAIDLAKAVSAATGLRLVSVPTTYSGAEWTAYFGVRDPRKRMVGGGGGAHLAGIVYEPQLTLDLPRAASGGTAMNALAHCAEALYVQGRNPEGDEHALEGTRLISGSLPEVLADGSDLGARTTLLRGAMHAGAALAAAGLGLAHAMAQAVGGRYGIPHGAANALCLPPALRFNEPVAAAEIAVFGKGLGTDDPSTRCEQLSQLAGYERLRDLGVPEDELDEVAEATAVRGGAKANPRPASPGEIAELFRSIW